MDSGEFSVEEQLAAALRGDAKALPETTGRPDVIEAVADAAIYHGVAGLLVDRPAVLASWPRRLRERLGHQARAQAMWEMRHRQILADLLTAFDQHGIRVVLMKGTAVAYDLYDTPAARSRGDTDLLVAAEDASEAKTVLRALGYAGGVLGGVTAEFALQQPWTLTVPDGGRHSIDLHWQVMNAPSLKDLLTFAESEANAQELPRLSPEARAMDRVRLLIHTCLHRAMHDNTPYFVERKAHYGSGRLIWSYDIHLLAEALNDDQWSLLCALAKEKGVSRACLAGLLAARAGLNTKIPPGVIAELEQSVGKDRASLYLVPSRALGRAWQDIRSVPGVTSKIRYARARILPDPEFVRAKYPEMAGASLARVYARRFMALVRSAFAGSAA